jgi:hypothetical protein
LTTTRTIVVAVALSLVLTVVFGLALGMGQVIGRVIERGFGATEARADAADSDGRMIAVTGPVGSGVSVLWLVDSEKKRISVYRCENGKNLVWVAARNVEWDFLVEGYKDDSELSSEAVRRKWERFATGRSIDKPPKAAGGAETEPVEPAGDDEKDR